MFNYTTEFQDKIVAELVAKLHSLAKENEYVNTVNSMEDIKLYLIYNLYSECNENFNLKKGDHDEIVKLSVVSDLEIEIRRKVKNDGDYVFEENYSDNLLDAVVLDICSDIDEKYKDTFSYVINNLKYPENPYELDISFIVKFTLNVDNDNLQLLDKVTLNYPNGRLLRKYSDEELEDFDTDIDEHFIDVYNTHFIESGITNLKFEELR